MNLCPPRLSVGMSGMLVGCFLGMAVAYIAWAADARLRTDTAFETMVPCVPCASCDCLLLSGLGKLASSNGSGGNGAVFGDDMVEARQALAPAAGRYKKAYVTLVSTAEYIIGARILICRLRSYSSETPIIVLVDASVGALADDPFYRAMRVDVLVVESPVPADVAQEIRVGTYTKLHVWNLESMAETVVYLDADTLPVRNPAGLFGALHADKTDKTAWDFYVHGSSGYFNSGVMVLRTSAATFRALQRRLVAKKYRKDATNPTEQDVLISHFASSKRARWESQDFMNFRTMHHGSLTKTAMIVHWAGNPKPWSKMLGHSTSVRRQKIDTSPHLPAWSQRLFLCEVERYLTSCHDWQTARSANFSCAD